MAISRLAALCVDGMFSNFLLDRHFFLFGSMSHFCLKEIKKKITSNRPETYERGEIISSGKEKFENVSGQANRFLSLFAFVFCFYFTFFFSGLR